MSKTFSLSRGVGISTYNRGGQIRQVVEAVLNTVPDGTLVVVADDGSTDNTQHQVTGLTGTDLEPLPVVYIRGSNKGVVANKNRLLTALRNCDFITLMEDDLIPTEGGWFETYEAAVIQAGIHHFCRVQGKEVDGKSPSFDSFMGSCGCTPIYSSSCRGDLVFISREVLARVGGLNPEFRGVGYGHLEWSERVVKAGLIPHPNCKWIDIKQSRDKFVQIGDTTGGRFEMSDEELKKQLRYNKEVLQSVRLREGVFNLIRFE